MNPTPRVSRYFAHYPLHHPAYMVSRRAGHRIRECARAYLNGRLLDIGCGAKWKWDLIGDLVDAYVGLDHEASMHDISDVDLVGVATEIPEADGVFDSVLCTTVLEHLEEPARAIEESFRVLKPGGCALYTAPFFWHLHEAPRDFFRYSPYGLRHLFESAGYEIVTLEPLSGFWLTFATEWNYHLLASTPRVLRPLARALIVLNNLASPALDAIDRRFNRRWSEWTWLHLVVVRKPEGA